MTAEPNRLALVPRELGRLTFVRDLEPLPLIDPTEAAQFLDVERHTLACYRSLGEGPPFYKFGRWIRYAREDLRHWRDASFGLAIFPVEDSEPEGMLLVAPVTAARYLTVTLPCMRNYRIEGTGPRYLRFGRRIHYPVHELRVWAESQRHSAGTGKSSSGWPANAQRV